MNNCYLCSTRARQNRHFRKPDQIDGKTQVYTKLHHLVLYHFDSVFLITVTVFSTHFPHRNSKNRHYETNIISKLATFEYSLEKLIIRANVCVIRGLTASHDPKICTNDEFFPRIFKSRKLGNDICFIMTFF